MTYSQPAHHLPGYHWETASIRQVLAAQGISAPHTGQPISEAMLLGLSGGIAAMYFTFNYDGLPPNLYIGTRSTFDPMETVYTRLGIEADVKQTTSDSRAQTNLIKALDGGQPVIVWADVYSLHYNALPPEECCQMKPVVVYDYDPSAEYAAIADRSAQPLRAHRQELTEARAQQPSMKYKQATLGTPTQLAELPLAIEESIQACVRLYLDKSPKGPKANFGLEALKKWAGLMTDASSKQGWPTLFGAGGEFYRALKTCYRYLELWGTGGYASRMLYADFLDEAAGFLGKDRLAEVGDLFRVTGEKWRLLAETLLAEALPVLGETRVLMDARQRLFIEEGEGGLVEMLDITARLDALERQVEQGNALPAGEVPALREAIRERIEAVYAAEKEAVLELQVAAA